MLKPIRDALLADNYTKGDADISVTGLIAPARQAQLRRMYEGQLADETPQDRVASWLGTLIHDAFQKADTIGECETRFFIKRHGWTVSGAVDRIVRHDDDGNPIPTMIQDYKTAGVTSAGFTDKPEWEQQLNLYRLMLADQGEVAETLEIVRFFPDWKIMQSKIKPESYPDFTDIIPVRVWGLDEAEEFLKDRLMAHGNAARELPECTPEERWQKPTLYKVKKKGGKRAVSGGVFEDRDAAEQLAESAEDLVVEVTEGSCTRCEHFCNVASFCDQWAKEKPAKLV